MTIVDLINLCLCPLPPHEIQTVTYSQGQQVPCSLHSPPHRSRCSTVFPALARAAANTLCTNPETKTQRHSYTHYHPVYRIRPIYSLFARPLPVPSTTTSNSDGSWSCGRCAMFLFVCPHTQRILESSWPRTDTKLRVLLLLLSSVPTANSAKMSWC